MGPSLYSPYAVKHCVESHNHRGPSTSSSGKGLDKFITVYNDSHRFILVKDRFGVTTFVKPQRRHPGRGECIQIQLQWDLDTASIKYTLEDLEKRYPRPTPLISSMLRAFRDALTQAKGLGDLVKTTPVWIDVPLNDLQDAGGKIYIAELDLTFAFEEKDNKAVDHPKSPGMRARETVADIAPALGADTMVFAIKAVDNGPCKTMEDRYIWIGNDVFHIPIEYDQTMPEGIHVICQPSATRKNSTRRTRLEPAQYHYSFTEADEVLGLSTTVEGARHRGNSKDALNEQFTRMQYEGKIEELTRNQAFSKEKYDRDVERLEYEAEQARLKHKREMDKARLEQERMRMEYDRRDQDYKKAEQDIRRDEGRGFTEWLKVVGGVITAGVAIAGLVSKMKPA